MVRNPNCHFRTICYWWILETQTIIFIIIWNSYIQIHISPKRLSTATPKSNIANICNILSFHLCLFNLQMLFSDMLLYQVLYELILYRAASNTYKTIFSLIFVFQLLETIILIGKKWSSGRWNDFSQVMMWIKLGLGFDYSVFWSRFQARFHAP